MVIKYIDNDYIINELGKTSWINVEEPDFYIKMASERVKRLIFPSEQGNPNNISTYTEEQQSAIKLATAKYTFWYFDTNYDQTSGSVSVSFGGVSMSESKSYNGETVLPEVYDILQQANLIPTTETFAILNTPYQQDWNKPDEFKKLQQELEIQTNNNIRQDAQIVKINDTLAAMSAFDLSKVKEDIEVIKEEQEEQNKAIETNFNEIETTKTDLGDLGNQVKENKTKINTNIEKIDQTRQLLNTTIQELKKLKPFNYRGEYQEEEAYNINEAVSIGNNLYLSNKDNNTSKPPSEDWVALELEGGGQIDLSNYYNKQQIDIQKQNLDNKINEVNTNLNNKQNILSPGRGINITNNVVETNFDIGNYISKTNKLVFKNKVFDGMIYFNNWRDATLNYPTANYFRMFVISLAGTNDNNRGREMFLHSDQNDEDYFFTKKISFFDYGSKISNQNGYVPVLISDGVIRILAGNWYVPNGGGIQVKIYEIGY